jgi:hypothetical protein
MKDEHGRVHCNDENVTRLVEALDDLFIDNDMHDIIAALSFEMTRVLTNYPENADESMKIFQVAISQITTVMIANIDNGLCAWQNTKQ